MHSNTVCHFAIHADNVARAKVFYQQVFGWQFEEWGPPDFYLIRTGQTNDPGILGALQKRAQPLGTGFNGYECSISVEDVKKMEAEIVKHGGNVVMKPRCTGRCSDSINLASRIAGANNGKGEG